jgi:hypothetical protein
MEAGFDAIVQATLRAHLFSGIADVLLRVDSVMSSLAGYAYEPADTKLSLSDVRQFFGAPVENLCPPRPK